MNTKHWKTPNSRNAVTYSFIDAWSLTHLPYRFIINCDICNTRHTSTCDNRINIAHRSHASLENGIIHVNGYKVASTTLTSWIISLENHDEQHSLARFVKTKQVTKLIWKIKICCNHLWMHTHQTPLLRVLLEPLWRLAWLKSLSLTLLSKGPLCSSVEYHPWLN